MIAVLYPLASPRLTSFKPGVGASATPSLLFPKESTSPALVARDALGRITQLKDVNNVNANLQLMTYTHDPVGNPIQILDSSGDLVQYGYDKKYRLTSADFSPVTNKSYQYGYDAVDNRTYASEDGPTTFAFNPAGQIVVANAQNVLSSYVYSSDGNNTVVQIGGGFVTMTYDQENRMTVHNDGAVFASMTYQPDGLKRTERLGADITTIVWDGSDYLCDI